MADDQIFISSLSFYAKEDREKARLLYDRLVKENFNPWLDQVNLIPGEEWRSAIQKAIKDSRLFILCLPPRAVSKKGFFQREIREAIEQYYEHPKDVIYIIPVLLEQCQVPDNLSHLHWVDISGEKGFDILIGSLRRILGEPPITDLQVRADAIYNSYLIRVSVLDESTKQPIVGAIVELNEINIQHSRRYRYKYIDICGKILIISPREVLKSTTDKQGIVYFGMLDEFLINPKILIHSL